MDFASKHRFRSGPSRRFDLFVATSVRPTTEGSNCELPASWWPFRGVPSPCRLWGRYVQIDQDEGTNCPRISPVARSPGPVFGGGIPSLLWQLA
jgi:hypothetical protein